MTALSDRIVGELRVGRPFGASSMAPRESRSVGRAATRLVLGALVTLATSGCAVTGPPSSQPPPPPGPGASRPEAGREVKTADEGKRDDVRPAEYRPDARAVATRDAPPGAAGAAAADGCEASFTLPDAIAYGVRNNPRLQQAAARAASAREGADIAFAPFLPELQYQYIFAAFNNPVIPGGAFVPASLERGVFNYSLNEFGIQWTILDFGRRAGHYGQALSRARAEGLVMERARQTIAYDVTSAYFQLLEARAQVRVRQEALQTAESVHRDVQTRQRGGTAELESTLRAEVEVSRTAEELVAIRQAALDAEALLNQALGRPGGGPLLVTDVARRPPFVDSLEDCLRRAATLRPEVGAALQEVAGAADGERTARGEMLPRIYTRGTVIQAELPRVFHGVIDGIGIHADQTLYNGGARRAALRQAHAERDAAAAGLRVVLNNVSAQVNLVYNAIATDRERIRLNAVGARQARENLRVVVVRYDNGDAIPTEVVDAQTALTTAQVRYYASVYSYLNGLARLEYTQGGDLSGFCAQVLQPPADDDQRIELPHERGKLTTAERVPTPVRPPPAADRRGPAPIPPRPPAMAPLDQLPPAPIPPPARRGVPMDELPPALPDRL